MKKAIDGTRRKVDMSPDGIDQRLRELGQLHRLAMALGRARRIGPAEQCPEVPSVEEQVLSDD